jgi:methyl-accepting chemotaxis protein
MGEGTAEVRKAVDETANAGAKLRSIIESAGEAAYMVNQIAAAATEQSSATDGVNRNVSEIARISLEASSQARHSATACAALSQLAVDLNLLIAKFKVEKENEPLDRRAENIVGRSTSRPPQLRRKVLA